MLTNRVVQNMPFQMLCPREATAASDALANENLPAMLAL
jgi:hypothetical protein